MAQVNTVLEKATKGRIVRGAWRRRLLSFLVVAGPGLIVMEADNDAGAVSTYVQAGAQYGTHLLWLLLILLPVIYFTQEMVARLGVATGQGHAAMIYARFGKWWGRFSLADLLVVNFLTLMTEFAAIDLAMSALGVAPWISVPAAAVGLTALVFSGGYLRWERITIGLCLLDVVWVGMAVFVHPNWAHWGEAARHAALPSIPPGGLTGSLVFLVIAIVGTTIAPWQLFFQQSCVAEKRLRFSDLNWERLDTLIGACFTIVVAAGMMIVGGLAYRHHLPFTDPAQFAASVAPFAGNAVRFLILLLMVNASVLGATAISLSSAWAYGEVKRWPHSLHKKVRDAPAFYAVYAGGVFAAAGLVLIPRLPLQLVILGVQALAGLMLPSAIIFLQLLLNDGELLGDRFRNKPWNNWVNWIIISLLFGLSLLLALQVAAPKLLALT
ncbi:MAG: Nramp family divalent metal transporter [Acidobacteriota bacterium]|nr:Nramp family divalent metal transporter [Acidobacteriota bacterium]